MSMRLQSRGSELDQALAASALRQSLRSYLRRRLPDDALADDLLQDIFVKAVSADRAGHKIDKVVGWLYAAARTAVADYYRSRRESTREVDASLPEEDADDLRLHSELAQCLTPFVEGLPPLYRDTILATDLRGERMRSLAERQQVSISAVKSRASRARSMLKQTVLACCHVELEAGLVSDYHRRTVQCGRGEKCS